MHRLFLLVRKARRVVWWLAGLASLAALGLWSGLFQGAIQAGHAGEAVPVLLLFSLPAAVLAGYALVLGAALKIPQQVREALATRLGLVREAAGSGTPVKFAAERPGQVIRLLLDLRRLVSQGKDLLLQYRALLFVGNPLFLALVVLSVLVTPAMGFGAALAWAWRWLGG